jgi:type I restriction enzyme M protein
MRHFATESGKSKGQFYTPAEVSRIMAQILGIRTPRPRRHHRLRPDLRLRLAAAEGGDEAGTSVTLYGQEKDAPPAAWPA